MTEKNKRNYLLAPCSAMEPRPVKTTAPSFLYKTIQAIFFSTIVFILSAPLTNPAAAAPPKLSDSENLYKAEGAHFEVGLDRWIAAAELTAKNGEKYYFTFNFFRSGAFTLHYHHGMAGLYDAGKNKYSHLTFAPLVYARAAQQDLLKAAEEHPDDAQKFKEAAGRIENGKLRNFMHLEETPDVYRNRLFIDHEKLHFKRTSKKELAYSLLTPVGKKTVVSLKMEALSDPVIFDLKKPIIHKLKNQLQGYVFPEVRFKGVITKGKKKIKVSGRGSYAHVFGNPSPGWMKNYREIYMRLGNGELLMAFVFFSPDGTQLGHRAALLGPDGAEREVKDLVLETGSVWKSKRSLLEYPRSMNIKSDPVEGKIELLTKKTEEHLIEGRGAFFFGPCDFEGKVGGVAGNVAGSGFCRMIVPGQ